MWTEHMNEKDRKHKGGFTLVELIVTMVILSVLSAIVVPTFAGFIDKDKEQECIAARKSLLTRYEADSLMESMTLDAYIEKSSDLKCPIGGTYTYDDTKKAIICSEGHDDVSAANITGTSWSASLNGNVDSGSHTGNKVTVTPTQIPQEPVYSVKINRDSVSLTKGSSDTLTATVCVDNVSDSSRGVNWMIEGDSSVAALAVEGNTVTITGLKEGNVTVKAVYTVNGTEKCSDVAVVSVVQENDINDTTNSLVTASSLMIIWNNNIELDQYVTEKDGKWTSDNANIAVCEKWDTFHAKGINCGSCTLTYTALDGTTAQVAVKVVWPFGGVGIWNFQNLMEGSLQTISGGFNEIDTTDKYVRWESSDSDIIEIVSYDSERTEGSKELSAVIRGVSPGTAQITLSMYSEYEGKWISSESITITVWAAAIQGEN